MFVRQRERYWLEKKRDKVTTEKTPQLAKLSFDCQANL